jgi:hypothetical protein
MLNNPSGVPKTLHHSWIAESPPIRIPETPGYMTGSPMVRIGVVANPQNYNLLDPVASSINSGVKRNWCVNPGPVGWLVMR